MLENGTWRTRCQWQKKPHPHRGLQLCAGCRYGITGELYEKAYLKYNIKKLINADYVGEDSSAVFNFLMSYVKGDILNVYLSMNDEVAPNCVTLTYTKQDS